MKIGVVAILVDIQGWAIRAGLAIAVGTPLA